MRLFSKSDQLLRKMEYISDQRGIINRYINEGKNWNLHLENTKKYIINSTKTKNKENVAILGSGWLLDLPLSFLNENFKTIYLVDIYHPRQIKI